MATKDDTRAALLLLVLALAGAFVRLLGLGGASPGEIGYRGGGEDRPSRDSVSAVASRLARPLGTGEQIDMDRADANELVRLPRIGPALAARILADRESGGPFGSLEGLSRVFGVGPGLVETIRPYAIFSGTVRLRQSPAKMATKVSLNTATADQLEQLPGIGPARAMAIVEDRRRNGRYRAIEDLARVRGIGAATISRLQSLVTVR